MIAAITADNALGRGGDMIFHLAADLRRFKQLTMGHPLVMGRRTFQSLPHALPGRRNIVVSRKEDFKAEGAEVFATLHDALDACGDAEAMVIGGGQIYAQAMPLASRLIITHIDATCPDADTFFPAISPDCWAVAEQSPWQTDPKTGTQFCYTDYVRIGDCPLDD